MKILFSGFRDKNHSQYGGYDHVVRFSNESYFLDAANVPFNFIPFDKRGKRINIYFLDLFSRLLRNKYDILHIFYGDVQIFFPYRKLLKNKIVATIHRSIESLTLRKINILRKFDSVIILSTEQCLKFRNLGINAKFIPHGFNTPNYNYNLPLNHGNKINLEKINIFFSGHHYRDFNMLYFFLENIKNKDDIIVHVLGQNSNGKELLKKYSNVIIWDRIPDNEYYSLLSICDYNFLPLKFATANNALLEAQSIGIRTIVSDIPGVKDYAHKSENLLFKNKPELIKLISGLKKEFPSDILKEYSKIFLWENIFKQLDEFYSSLFSK